MTFRILIFLTRKAGISHAEFKKHYESSHIPLLQQFGGEYFPKRHTRHYLQFNDDQPVVLQGKDAGSGFDALAEVVFDDENGFKNFIQSLRKKLASATLIADEDKFSDRGKMIVVPIADTQGNKK